MSFRDFLGELDKDGEVVKVTCEVDPNLEVARHLAENDGKRLPRRNSSPPDLLAHNLVSLPHKARVNKHLNEMPQTALRVKTAATEESTPPDKPIIVFL